MINCTLNLLKPSCLYKLNRLLAMPPPPPEELVQLGELHSNEWRSGAQEA